jgi:ectoine hydroxylase-related dioxygenase (phytanoyl-CoA dioxygenase family)
VLALPGTIGGEPVVRDALGAAVARLVEQGLPATFVYLFDEPWIIGTQLAAAVSRMLGRSYVLAADGYAWHVPVGTGRGWEPHRDERYVLDRRAPERVNVWLAITDATAERACVHAVPLDEDPGYPSDLRRKDPPLTAVRALPVAAGTALAWNANLLHWGGACSSRACGARSSISFTALRADAAGQIGLRRLKAEMLSPTGRLDLVASLIAAYEHHRGPDVSDEIMMWAQARWGLADRTRQLAMATDAPSRRAAGEEELSPPDPTAAE